MHILHLVDGLRVGGAEKLVAVADDDFPVGAEVDQGYAETPAEDAQHRILRNDAEVAPKR